MHYCFPRDVMCVTDITHLFKYDLQKLLSLGMKEKNKNAASCTNNLASILAAVIGPKVSLGKVTYHQERRTSSWGIHIWRSEAYDAGLLTIRKDVPHLEVWRSEAYDAGLVQLWGDGWGEWQELGQLQELCVLLLPSTPSSVLALLLHS